MAPNDEVFAIGDMVEVKGMPDSSELNGVVGTLTKTIGKGRWALKVEGEERTKVVMEDNLIKYTPQAGSKPTQKFDIVGTWDDWEPQPMVWNQETTCFEYNITLGHDGAESFKILLNGDWDSCVYPDRKDACPHQAHQVKGPDDGGLDEEWTVGMHEADKASTGDKFLIKFFVSHDGKPKRVTWEKIGGTEEEASGRTGVSEKVPKKVEEEEATPRRPAKKFEEPAEEAKAPPPRPRWSAHMPEPEDDVPKSRGGLQWAGWRDARGEEDVVAIEKAARERLAKRLEDAAQIGMGMPMIRDGNEDDAFAVDAAERMQITLARDEEERTLQVEVNKERYRRSIEEAVRERASVTKAKTRTSGQCAECGQATTHMYGQTFCCESCLEAWEMLRQEGWNGATLTGGVPAAQRAQQLCFESKGAITTTQARMQVMREFAPSFRVN